ncbi:lipase family alpha/beta hydrolase [Vibrio rumoiensis]|uniref:Lipase n=1 Tax=Vibrio rumoiensis 1S-45 TaxID=1188252 RepID=A0A1E5E156_9VIBR|nr:triacylglycerol lipase [Vibrio rumoiensis]OEF24243.1 lipase [Vibrio rumoiensis 1S-45]
MKNKLCITVLLFTSTLFSLQAHSSNATKYPIVLVHGLFGFNDIWGIDYFYNIPQTLKRSGAQVYIASVSPANSSEVRGEQLRTYIQAVLAQSGAKKVNIIGHSHGSPTARYVASVSPEMVASVTSIGGVNWGSTFADVLRKTIPTDSALENIASQGFNALATVISGVSGQSLPASSLNAMDSLTTQGSILFNQSYPEGIPSRYCGSTPSKAQNGVHYFSWSGAKPATNVFDISDPVLFITNQTFSEKNDGLVSSCSSHLGQVIKDDYRMNHLDEVNQTFGLVSWFETNPTTLYRKHLDRLQRLGL